MSDKANSFIDQLNKILTNTIDYKEVLTKFSTAVSHEPTQAKLRELAEVKQEESSQLMNLIKNSGGQIETNERITDQESLYWIARPLPEPSDTSELLKKLTQAEKKRW